jgi:hypothetical protein
VHKRLCEIRVFDLVAIHGDVTIEVPPHAVHPEIATDIDAGVGDPFPWTGHARPRGWSFALEFVLELTVIDEYLEPYGHRTMFAVPPDDSPQAREERVGSPRVAPTLPPRF